MGLGRIFRKVVRYGTPVGWAATAAGQGGELEDAIGGPSGQNLSALQLAQRGGDTEGARVRDLQRKSPWQVEWDPVTMRPKEFDVPAGGSDVDALDYQAHAERLAQQRREQLFSDAQGSYRTAESIFSNYRPGGAQALASGLYQNRANLYAQQAAMVEAPDLLPHMRNHEQVMAAREQKRAARMQQVMGIVSLGASALTAGLTGAPGAAPNTAGQAATPGGAGVQSYPAGAGQQGAPTQPGTSPQTPGSLGAGMDGPRAPGQQFQGGLGQEGPGSLDDGDAPGGSTDIGGPVGQARLGGGPSGGPESPGGAGSPGAPNGMGGQSMGAGLGGYGQDGDFSPVAMSAGTARANPNVSRLVAMEYADELDDSDSQALSELTDRLLLNAFASLGVV